MLPCSQTSAGKFVVLSLKSIVRLTVHGCSDARHQVKSRKCEQENGQGQWKHAQDKKITLRAVSINHPSPAPVTHLSLSDCGSFGGQRVGEGDGVQDHSGLIAIFLLLPGVKDNIWEGRTTLQSSNWGGISGQSPGGKAKPHNQAGAGIFFPLGSLAALELSWEWNKGLLC